MTERLIGGDAPLPSNFESCGATTKVNDSDIAVTHVVGGGELAPATQASGGAGIQVSIGGDSPIGLGGVKEKGRRKVLGEEASTSSIGDDDDEVDTDSNLLRKRANLPLATVAAHTQRMRELLTVLPPPALDGVAPAVSTTVAATTDSSTTTTTTSVSGVFSGAKKLTQDEIAELDEMADQVYYWALAESHFPDHGSVLMECEALETLVLMVNHDRSPVILAGLRPLPTLLLHPLHKKLFQRLPNIVNLLLGPMLKFPNKIEVQEGALRCLCVVAAHNSEHIVHSEQMVSAVLQAMAIHRTHVGVQLHGCKFFAVLAPVPRKPFFVTNSDGGEEQIIEHTPIAIIFTHVGDVLTGLLSAADRFISHSEITAAVLTTLSALCAYPQNVETLAGTTVVTAVSNALTGHMHEPLILADCITILAAMTAELVTMQKRSIILMLKKVMSSTSHVGTLTNCVALVHSIILSYNIQRRSSENQIFTNREVIRAHNEGIEQGKIPEGTPAPVTIEDEVTVDDSTVSEWREEEFKMKQFCATEIIPFIALGLQHFADEDDVYRTTADACLRSLTISKW